MCPTGKNVPHAPHATLVRTCRWCSPSARRPSTRGTKDVGPPRHAPVSAGHAPPAREMVAPKTDDADAAGLPAPSGRAYALGLGLLAALIVGGSVVSHRPVAVVAASTGLMILALIPAFLFHRKGYSFLEGWVGGGHLRMAAYGALWDLRAPVRIRTPIAHRARRSGIMVVVVSPAPAPAPAG